MENKKETVIGLILIIVLVVATIGAASFTGYYIYWQLKPINTTGPGIQGYVTLKFITTEVKLPVNTTGAR